MNFTSFLVELNEQFGPCIEHIQIRKFFHPLFTHSNRIRQNTQYSVDYVG